MGTLVLPLLGPLGGSSVVTADVWAQDLLSVSIGAEVRNDQYLQSTFLYNVVPLDGGQAVTVTAVQTGNASYVTEIFLVVTNFTIGKKYRIYISGAYYVDGSVMPSTYADFVGRTTKEDSIIRSRPELYDMSPDATLRKVFQAIGRSDDLIGGSRSDRINK